MFIKGRAVVGFPFGPLIHKDTGAKITTGVVTGYVTLDGGIQAVMTGAATHEGNGQWSWSEISAAQMNGDLVGPFFAHADAVGGGIGYTIKTQTEEEASPPLDAGDLIELASSPKRIRTDEGTVEERSIDELIKAHEFATAAESKIRFFKTKSGSSVS